jgi:hypothetical protein
MPSIRQSIRSSTASKRPTSAIADGQIALNTASGTPGMFFKDSAGNIVKTGPAHYGATAPNSSPAVGGSTGNSIGEAWLDVSLTPAGWKIWNGSAWVNATPLSSDTVQGLVELATNAETQTGVDTARAVTAASLQSKVSDSISTTSASGIASSTAVKTAYDLANAALPKSGGIVTGNLEIGSTGSFTFEGATADGFETTLDVVDPTADRTITFPNTTGTVVTTGDTGTVTSTMILDGTILNADINTSAAIAFSKLATLSSANILVGSSTGVPTSRSMSGDITIGNTGVTAIAAGVIVNADINSAAAIAYSKLALSSGITNTDVSASAAIVDTKLATIATALKVSNSATTAASANTASAIVARDASGNFIAGTITAALTGAASSNVLKAGDTMTGALVVPAGTVTANGIQVGTGTTYKPGIYSPGADQLAISTNGTEKLIVKSDGKVGLGTSSPGGKLHIALTSSATTPIVNVGSFGVNGVVTLGSIANNSEQVYFGTGDVNGGGIAAGIGFLREAAGWNSSLAFYTNNVTSGPNGVSAIQEKMRITSGGLVGIGTTSPARALDVNGSIQLPSNNALYISGSNNYLYADSSATELASSTQIVFVANGSQRATIDSSGRLLVATTSASPHSSGTYGIALDTSVGVKIGSNNIHALIAARWNGDGEAIRLQRDNTTVGTISVTTTATTYNTSSDYRLKENVTPVPNGITRLLQLKPSRFNFIADPDRTVDGFLAHEAQAVVPECVTGEKNAVDEDGNPVFQGIDQSKLVPLLTAALQEAVAKIEALETRLSAAGIA